VGLAVRAGESGQDTAAEVAAWGPWGTREWRQTAFLGGREGRRRVAVIAAAFLNGILREETSPTTTSSGGQ
jgi:hypothetical protein